MAFVKPTFNIVCNIWRRSTFSGDWPPTVPAPTLASVPCQLRPNLKNITSVGTPFEEFSLQELCVAKDTDVRDPLLTTLEYGAWPDIAEVPASSGRYYMIVAVVDVGRGFMNQWRACLIIPTTAYQGGAFDYLENWPYAPDWPTPYP